MTRAGLRFALVGRETAVADVETSSGGAAVHIAHGNRTWLVEWSGLEPPELHERIAAAVEAVEWGRFTVTEDRIELATTDAGVAVDPQPTMASVRFMLVSEGLA